MRFLGPNSDHTEGRVSTIHQALRAPRRRLTILFTANHFVADPSGANADKSEITVRFLAKQIASIEQGVHDQEVTGSQYRNVYTALTQVHLPKLDDINVVEYNDDRKTVKPSTNLMPMASIVAITTPVALSLIEVTQESEQMG